MAIDRDRDDISPARRAFRKGLPKSVLLRWNETDNDDTREYDALVEDRARVRAANRFEVWNERARESGGSALSWVQNGGLVQLGTSGKA